MLEKLNFVIYFHIIVIFCGVFLYKFSDITVRFFYYSVIFYSISLANYTYFANTDWNAYRNISLEIAERDIFFQDGIFWMLFYKIQSIEVNDLLFASAINLICILLFLKILKSIGLGRRAVMVGVILLLVSNGYSLGTDWYIRHNFANYLILWALISFIYSNSYYQFNSTYYFVKHRKKVILSSCLVMVAALIHSGAMLYFLLIVLSYLFSVLYVSKKTISVFWLGESPLPAINYVPFFIMIILSTMTMYILRHLFDDSLPRAFFAFEDSPFSILIIPILGYLVVFNYFLDMIKGYDLIDFQLLQKYKLTLRVFIGTLFLSLSIYPFFPYLLRVNMFKDILVVIAIAILVNVREYFQLSATQNNFHRLLSFTGGLLLISPYLRFIL